jgi:hypothetical protein
MDVYNLVMNINIITLFSNNVCYNKNKHSIQAHSFQAFCTYEVDPFSMSARMHNSIM